MLRSNLAYRMIDSTNGTKVTAAASCFTSRSFPLGTRGRISIPTSGKKVMTVNTHLSKYSMINLSEVSSARSDGEQHENRDHDHAGERVREVVPRVTRLQPAEIARESVREEPPEVDQPVHDRAIEQSLQPR